MIYSSSIAIARSLDRVETGHFQRRYDTYCNFGGVIICVRLLLSWQDSETLAAYTPRNTKVSGFYTCTCEFDEITLRVDREQYKKTPPPYTRISRHRVHTCNNNNGNNVGEGETELFQLTRPVSKRGQRSFR